MSKIRFWLRRAVALIVALLFVAAFAGKFYGVKIFDIQLVALLQNIRWSTAAALGLFAVVLLTFIGGRLYCSTLCPLGIFQELLIAIFHRKQKMQKNRIVKYFIAAVVFGSLIGGTVFLLRVLDPYSLSGAAASGALIGVCALVLIAVLSWFKGRYFCTNICPAGALLGLISKFSLCKIYISKDTCVSCGNCAKRCPSGCIDFKNKQVDNEICVKCLKCTTICPKNSLHYGQNLQLDNQPEFSIRRRQFIIGAAVLTVFGGAVSGGINLAKMIAQKFKNIIVPAGADNAGDFANRCLNCNLCVQNCPMKIIKKADAQYPAVHIEYDSAFCAFDCYKCGEVCPSGAIKRMDLAQKQKTRIGLAHIDENTCIRCGLCIMKCPRETIVRNDGGIVKIMSEGCIGCGACKVVCPAKAISITATEKQTIII